MSHCPLMGRFDPPSDVVSEVYGRIEAAHGFVEEFDPELVILIAPDHYNGFFYRMMPQFCVGTHAVSVGDYGTEKGEMDVDTDTARDLAASLLARDIDVAVSERMSVDHGFAQPFALLTGSLGGTPVVPVFINCAAPPLNGWARTRAFGEAIGSYLAGQERRVMLIGSGGLSHDPPLPSVHAEDPAIVERAISGAGNEEARPTREANAVKAAEAFVAGTSPLTPLNEEWDKQVVDALAAGSPQTLDAFDNAWVTEHCGRGAHETRTWAATYGALGEGYEVGWTYYRPVKEWLTGFGITVATAAA